MVKFYSNFSRATRRIIHALVKVKINSHIYLTHTRILFNAKLN